MSARQFVFLLHSEEYNYISWATSVRPSPTARAPKLYCAKSQWPSELRISKLISVTYSSRNRFGAASVSKEVLKDRRPDDVHCVGQNTLDLQMKSIILVITLTTSLTTLAFAGDDGFRALFNGTNTAGWHLRKADGHNTWTVENGVLKNTVAKGEHGTDLVTDQKFQNFTVKYEFMVPDNSNSGFYLRGRHEIQILGDFAKGKTGLGGNGALYNFKVPDQFVSKPGGEWQTAEATIIGNKITLTLNGVKVHDNVECNKPTGGELDNKVNEPGPILLQGDHGTVWFRNIQIKELK